MVACAASFLVCADSRASFEIEGEKPPRTRLERWGRAVLQAGKNKLTLDEILRLHAVLIGDTRFTRPGLRRDGVSLSANAITTAIRYRNSLVHAPTTCRS